MVIFSPLTSISTNASLFHPHYLSNPHTNEKVVSDWLQPDYVFPQDKTPVRINTMSHGTSSSPDDEGEASAGIQSNDLDWARNKELIIKLYIDQNLSMRDLIKTMSEKYGFKATKRMYHTRFAIWGVYKNTKASTKSRFAFSVIEAYRQKHELPNLTDSEKLKLVRYSMTSRELSKEDRATLVQAITRMTEARQRMTGSTQNSGP